MRTVAGTPRLWAALCTALLAATLLVAVGPAAPASASANEIYNLVNAERKKQGLPLLTRNSALDKVAQDWTATMVRNNRMEHNPRLTGQVPSGWRYLGENVGYAGSASQLQQAWMNSSGHRRNILDKDYNSIGIGFVVVGRQVWGTQVFAQYPGVKAPSGSLPAVLPRLAGADRYATAAQVALNAYPKGAGTVYVATGATFPDALGGGPAAAQLGGPVLLVGNTLPAATRDALQKLKPQRIVVLGRGGAVSSSVEASLRRLAPSVTRQAGDDRYQTAARVATAAFPNGADTVYVATGRDFPDALGGGPAAAKADGPMLLVDTGVPSATRDALQKLGPRRIVILGSTGVVPGKVESDLRRYAGSVSRQAGANRYATAARVALASHPRGADTVYVATGTTFADALGGGPAAARAGAPLLLVNGGVPAETRQAIQQLKPRRIVVLGGTGVVSRDVEYELRKLIP